MKKTIFYLLVLWLSCSVSVFAENSDLTALIQKGDALIKQGSYPAGIAVLETVLTKDPNNPKALNSLLAACDNYSQQLLAQNNYSLAENYLKKMDAVIQKMESLPDGEFSNRDASSSSRIKREMARAKAFLLNPDGQSSDLVSLNAGREQYNEAVKYFNQRQYDVAESLLKESIKLDPSNSYAYELLGEIANLNQRLDEAEGYYKQAFMIDSDPALRAKYEKLMREKKIDEKQQQYEDEHFIIRYRRNEALEGSEIRELLRDAYRSISQAFGHYPSYKIPVLLYSREEYQKSMGSVPHWSGALFDGKIRIPVYSGTPTLEGFKKVYDTPELKKLIHHELTHAFVLDLSQTKCPIWLNEGLAQYFENKVKPLDMSMLKQAVKNNSLMSPDQLMFEDISKITSHEKALLYYQEAFSLVSYIIEKKRIYQMKQFLIALGKGTDFGEAFEKAFGQTFRDISDNWKSGLA